jgi:hypothetical protein
MLLSQRKKQIVNLCQTVAAPLSVIQSKNILRRADIGQYSLIHQSRGYAPAGYHMPCLKTYQEVLRC